MKRRRIAITIGAVGAVLAAALVAAPAVATNSYIPPKFAVGNDPGGIAFTPDGTKAVLATADPDQLDGHVAVISTATHKTLASFETGPYSNGVTVCADGKHAYVANPGDDTNAGGVSAINLADLAGGIESNDAEGNIWDVACSPDSSVVYGVIPWNDDPNGIGSVRVIDTATNVGTASIQVGVQPLAVAFAPNGSEAFVVNAGDGSSPGTVSVIDVASSSVVSTIPTGLNPDGIAVTPDGSTVLVSNYGDGTHAGWISVIDVATKALLQTISGVGVGPQAIRVTPDGTRALVTNGGSGTVSIIDLATKKVANTIVVGGQPWSLAVLPNGSQAWATIDGLDSNVSGTVATIDIPSATWSPTVSRVWGADRYATAVAVAKAAFPDLAPIVFVATGTNFPDALGAAAAAAKEGGPLLLTAPTSLPSAVKTEIEQLDPAKIVVIGATGAVSAGVFNQLNSLLPDTTVSRVSGADRYATARAIVQTFFDDGTGSGAIPNTYIATGQNFPDALSASAAAGSRGIPVLLVNGTKSTLGAATMSLLAARGTTTFTIAGGTGAVSQGIQNQLQGISGASVVRLSGIDRYVTSRAISVDAFPTPSAAYFATGSQYADALSGAVLAATRHAPLYTVAPTCVPSASEHVLAAAGTSAITLLGGTGALSATVAKMRNC